MYCKNCGTNLNSNQAICVKCGVLVGNGNTYCANCGKEMPTNAIACIFCGTSTILDNTSPNNTKNITPQRPWYGFFITSLILASLTTLFLAIPDYFWLLSSSHYYNSMCYYYSFIEWTEGWSATVLLLLWANPVISLICSLKKANYRFIKIITSLILFVLVFLLSVIDGADGYGSMFGLTIIMLTIQIVFSILETIFVIILTKKDANNTTPKQPISYQKSTPQSSVMFCKNCGVQMNTNQAICVKCGVPTGRGTSFCSNCGNTLTENAAFCINCGIAIQNQPISANAINNIDNLGGQDKITIALLCFFLGGIGIHNFIMGEKKKGIMKIVFYFLCGISSIFALIDFIKIMTDKYEVNYEKHF